MCVKKRRVLNTPLNSNPVGLNVQHVTAWHTPYAPFIIVELGRKGRKKIKTGNEKKKEKEKRDTMKRLLFEGK